MPHKRRALVRGFVLILGMFALLFVLAVALITALLLGPLQQPLSNPAFAVALFCSVPLVFFFPDHSTGRLGLPALCHPGGGCDGRRGCRRRR